MSLVAYAGSDDSESDKEEQEESEAISTLSSSSKTQIEKISGHISDDDDDFAGVSSSTGESLQSYIFSGQDSVEAELNQSEKVNSTSLASLQGKWKEKKGIKYRNSYSL